MRGCKWMMAAVASAVCSLALGGGTSLAQTGASRLEVGASVPVLRLSDSADTGVGVAGRVTVDLSRWFSLEAEYQYLPDDEIDLTSRIDGGVAGVRYERRRSTGLFGIKAGQRGERVGVFAKVRPGVTRLADRGVECRGDVCALMLLVVPEYRSEFALDVGGIVEFYPSPRWVARVDLGTLVIRHRSSAPPCAAGDCTTSNFAASLGVGVRF